MKTLKSDNSTVRQWLNQGEEPLVAVGIMQCEQIRIVLTGTYLCAENGLCYSGNLQFEICDHQIRFQDRCFEALSFLPQSESCVCELKDVTIGIGFHWQRNENQQFEGSIHLLPNNGKIQVINRLGVEKYLYAVIGSEMSATSYKELLKAHAVISRSWLLAPMTGEESTVPMQQEMSNGEIVRWYERDAHTLFDVCADDHCQRYQGITRTGTEAVREAIAATRGELLMMDNEICDARFSKSCGGATEYFHNCWSSKRPYTYLQSFRDAIDQPLPDLTQEAEAERWIRSTPTAFCNIAEKEVLRQVLNGYDQETADFFRWTIHYSFDELSAIVKEKSGYDFGRILELVPLSRGASGRITRLKIVGERMTMTVGKELEIRKWLSPTHLYSSAFVVDTTDEGFTLTGAGWGHGVGLCQIGAAQMAHQGFTYQEILNHYFRGATLVKKW